MIKKTITYVDYNDVEHTEDFYFNFNKAELIEMETSVDGGLSALADKIVKANNVPELTKLFKKLVLDAYGVKSADGKRFIKSKELREEFEQTEAYSQLYMELVTNTEAAVNFFNGVLPKGLSEEVAKMSSNSTSASK